VQLDRINTRVESAIEFQRWNIINCIQVLLCISTCVCKFHSSFAFNFNLRRYDLGVITQDVVELREVGRCR